MAGKKEKTKPKTTRKEGGGGRQQGTNKRKIGLKCQNNCGPFRRTSKIEIIS